MKRICCAMVCILILCGFLPAGMAEREIPDVLRVTQEIISSGLNQHRIITYSVLHTVREDVNEAINARVAALTEEAEPLLPQGKPCRADICTQITRTGNRWMSFHICAQVSYDNNQHWVKSEEYTYDMESGRLILLGEIISEDGWEPLLRQIRTQLETIFPENAPDEKALNALCQQERIAEAGFIVTPGHLALFFPAADLYPTHAEALLRVEIYVPELRDILTEEACRETDCTGYDLVAMTYDDGPAKGNTWNVLNVSVCHPGQVTFFVIGKRLEKNAELVHREFDAGHSVQSHTWQHSREPKDVRPEKVVQWETEFDRTLGNMIGVVPVMMRPPGGYWKLYQKAGTKSPMVVWSINSQDVVSKNGIESISHYSDCALSAKDGDIVLFHDVKHFSGKLAERCMSRFEERNVLLVTVNDLCALRGISQEAGSVLTNCPPAGNE